MQISKLFRWQPGSISALQIFQWIRFSSLLLISILLSKSGLSTQEIGVYESVLFLAGLVSFFWITGYIQSYLSIYSDFDTNGKQPAIFNGALVLFVAALLAIIGLLIVSRFFTLEMLGFEKRILVLLLVFILLSAPSSIIEYVYLLQGRTRALIRYGLISYALQIFLVALPLYLGHSIEYSILGLAVSAAVRLVYLWSLIQRYSEFRIHAPFIISSLQTAWPLVFVAFIGGSATYIDNSVVYAYFDEASFAVFRYGARELPFVVLFANAVSNAMVPEFANKQALEGKLAKLKLNSTRLAHVFFPISIGLIFVSEWIFPIIFNPDFAESAQVFKVYLLIISSRLVFPQTILYGFRNNLPVLFIGAFALIVHLGISLGLVGIYGLVGVAFAGIIANIIDKGLMALYLYRIYQIPVRDYLDLHWWLIYNGLLFGVYFFH